MTEVDLGVFIAMTDYIESGGRITIYLENTLSIERAPGRAESEVMGSAVAVILVSHSMGGLVARAVIHPEMGKLNDKVLGIVHGVMPAIGAGAAYKRMRCGVEGDDIAAKVIGDKGTLMTAVPGNAQGGLALLPSQAYGNNWLQGVKQ